MFKCQIKSHAVARLTMLFASVCFVCEPFSTLSTTSKAFTEVSASDVNIPASTEKETDTDASFVIPDAEYIKQSYSFHKTGFLQSEYTDETGEKINLPGTIPSSPVPGTDAETKETLPVSYDLRENGVVTSIKDQQTTGCCWSFAVLKSLESNLIKTGKAADTSLDLSESHLAWYLYHPSVSKDDTTCADGITFNKAAARSLYEEEDTSYKEKYSFPSFYHTLPYLNGGNALFGTYILAKWSGAVTEEKAPLTARTAYGLHQMGNQMYQNTELLRYSSDYILTDSVCYDEADRSVIKNALLEHGAMEVSLYYSSEYASKTSDGEIAYHQDKYKETAKDHANHCVTILGWDDNYPKENFSSSIPSENGAWLIANSYGTEFGKDGTFWVSYEEASLVDFYSFRGDKRELYDNNYQYDGCGWTVALSPQDETPQKAANIFTANPEYTQSLNAVSFYTVTDAQPYTISIYQNVTPGKPQSGTKAAELSGTEELRGYHTITLPEPVQLKAGEHFSVVVSYLHTTKTNGYLPLEGPESTSDSLNLSFSSNAQESYLYSYAQNTETGKFRYRWVDLDQTLIQSASGNSSAVFHNACIKAFTKNLQYAGKVILSTNKLTLGKKETQTVTVSVKQSNDKKVIFTSSQPKIATVTQKGKIIAKRTGTVTITAALESGASDSIVVKVKKAPERLSITPQNAKTIPVGKGFAIQPKLPSGSACSTFTYTSSNPKIANINKNGYVAGKKPGTATITVKTYNNKTVRLTVIVTR